MKHILLVLSAATTLSGCAAVKVAHTDVASGATNPRAIYIRSYADNARFKGNHGHVGEKPIRKALAPAEYSKALKEELEKLAPARVLQDDEAPTTGWLVESNLEWVHGGSPALRAAPILGHAGVGRSHVRIHVRVTDLDGGAVISDSKKDVSEGAAREIAGEQGPVIYEFDLAGGSRLNGRLGSITSSGLGYATPFDYKNAAERVMMALSVDPHRYGTRSSPVIR